MIERPESSHLGLTWCIGTQPTSCRSAGQQSRHLLSGVQWESWDVGRRPEEEMEEKNDLMGCTSVEKQQGKVKLIRSGKQEKKGGGVMPSDRKRKWHG